MVETTKIIQTLKNFTCSRCGKQLNIGKNSITNDISIYCNNQFCGLSENIFSITRKIESTKFIKGIKIRDAVIKLEKDNKKRNEDFYVESAKDGFVILTIFKK